MKLDRNGYFVFNEKELAALNRKNPTIYSVVKWVMNHPDMKKIYEETGQYIQEYKGERMTYFSSNFSNGICPIGSIIRNYVAKEYIYCLGFGCELKVEDRKALPDFNASCLEIRWLDITGKTGVKYKNIPPKERREMFDDNPFNCGMSIKVV